MTPRSCSVFVLAVPGRDTHDRCLGSLEASDVGEHYTVREHPPCTPPAEHWYQTHLLAARAQTELVILLEDDVIVNRHLLWNVGTWAWTKHREFRAGWLYNPGGHTGFDAWYDGPPEWHGTVGVVYRTSELAGLVERAWPRIVAGTPWDLAISWAANTAGRIRMHFPALVEHLDDAPSIVGNMPNPDRRTSRGTFDLHWRRPERHQHGLLDEHGREAHP